MRRYDYSTQNDDGEFSIICNPSDGESRNDRIDDEYFYSIQNNYGEFTPDLFSIEGISIRN